MSINTFKVRDGRIRVYKKYVYKLCSVLFQPSLLRAARSCSIFSGLLLVSQSLGSILSRPQTLSLYLSILRFVSTHNKHTHSHTHAYTHVRTFSRFELLSSSSHSYFRLIHSRPVLRIYHYTHHASS